MRSHKSPDPEDDVVLAKQDPSEQKRSLSEITDDYIQKFAAELNEATKNWFAIAGLCRSAQTEGLAGKEATQPLRDKLGFGSYSKFRKLGKIANDGRLRRFKDRLAIVEWTHLHRMACFNRDEWKKFETSYLGGTGPVTITRKMLEEIHPPKHREAVPKLSFTTTCDETITPSNWKKVDGAYHQLEAAGCTLRPNATFAEKMKSDP